MLDNNLSLIGNINFNNEITKQKTTKDKIYDDLYIHILELNGELKNFSIFFERLKSKTSTNDDVKREAFNIIKNMLAIIEKYNANYSKYIALKNLPVKYENHSNKLINIVLTMKNDYKINKCYPNWEKQITNISIAKDKLREMFESDFNF